jgi:hypothetical protein
VKSTIEYESRRLDSIAIKISINETQVLRVNKKEDLCFVLASVVLYLPCSRALLL